MKKLATLCIGILIVSGCKSSTSSLTPIQQAGCDIESAITSGAASAIAGALSCTNQAAIQTSLNSALGNANLCTTAVPATQVPATASAVSKVAPKWATLGDVKSSDLHGQQSVSKAVARGVIGNLACPIAVDTIVGFLTNSIPASWGCSAQSTMQQAEAAINDACEAAVPI